VNSDRLFPPPWSVEDISGAFVGTTTWLPRFFFVPPPFSKKIQQKTFHPRILSGNGEKQMISTRFPLLGAIAVIAVMIMNCRVAVAGPNQTSADYVMPGCRDAASLITFPTQQGPKNSFLLRASVRGSLLASASWASLTAYVCPLARLLNKSPVSSFSISTDSPRGFARTSTL